MIGDFYPLFPHLESEDVWFGCQFHRPDLEAGMALLFRREKCAEPARSWPSTRPRPVLIARGIYSLYVSP